MAFLDLIDSWAKCKTCGQILWCEKSVDLQSCGCACGDLVMVNGEIVVSRNLDRKWKSADMEAHLLKHSDELMSVQAQQ